MNVTSEMPREKIDELILESDDCRDDYSYDGGHGDEDDDNQITCECGKVIVSDEEYYEVNKGALGFDYTEIFCKACWEEFSAQFRKYA